jgi:hypothetical protein
MNIEENERLTQIVKKHIWSSNHPLLEHRLTLLNDLSAMTDKVMQIHRVDRERAKRAISALLEDI